MEKIVYTPTEFAAIFGKERTWAYRQMYKGKVQAITDLGRTMIPKTEVDRLLKEAGRYMGANIKVLKENPLKSKRSVEPVSQSGNKWRESVKKRKQGGKAS